VVERLYIGAKQVTVNVFKSRSSSLVCLLVAYQRWWLFSYGSRFLCSATCWD